MNTSILRSLAVPALATLFLSACSVPNPFSTAGSLRVEVEVYKGPLSKEPRVQWGELRGIIDEAGVSLTTINDGILVAAANTGSLEQDGEICTTPNAGLKVQPHYRSGKSLVVQPKIHTRTVGKPCGDGIGSHDKYKFWCASPGYQRDLHGINPDGFVGCLILSQLHDDAKLALNQIEKLRKGADKALIIGTTPNLNTLERVKMILQGATRLGTQLKAKAFFWAETHASAAPRNRLVRNAMTNFSNWAAEYSNQLASRGDALLKQMSPVPTDRRELPLSVLLRDTTPTDFVNLYIWNRAAAPAILEEMLLHPVNAFRSEETTDRVRVIERLFSDHNWSKINTVFASGEGKTHIALIKDDIGNWNLKSFDSDPTELLEAYKRMTLAGIDAATKAITAGGSGGTAAFQSIMKTASSLTRGKIVSGDSVGGLNIKALHQRTLGRLGALRTRQVKEEERLQKHLAESETALEKNPKGAEEIKKNDENQSKIASLQKDTLKETIRIIDNHEFLINTLEQSVVMPEPSE